MFNALNNYGHVQVNLSNVVNNNQLQVQQQVTDELSSYSLTPKTIRKREITNIEDQSLIDNYSKLKVQLQQHELSLDNFNLQTATSVKLTNAEQAKKDQMQSKIDDVTHQIDQLEKYATQLGIPTVLNVAVTGAKDDILFIDEYSNADPHYPNANISSVTRYGINAHHFDRVKADNVKIIDSTVVINNTGSQGSAQSGRTASSASAIAKSKVLHPLEIAILQNATDFLDSNNTPDKVVIVDIFARDKKGNIVWDTQHLDKPETHAIVIYKNYTPNVAIKEYLVIDPSDTNHSKHVEFNSHRVFLDGQATFVTATIDGKDAQIYVAPRNDPSKINPLTGNPPLPLTTGPNADQFRDCIDIAVKLAFNLQNYNGIIDPKSIATLPEIQQISNKGSINPYIANKPSLTAFKIQQASSNEVRKQIDTIIIKQFFKAEFVTTSLKSNSNLQTLADAFEKEYLNTFQEYNNDKYYQGKQEIIKLCELNTQIFHDIVNAEQAEVSVLGNITP